MIKLWFFSNILMLIMMALLIWSKWGQHQNIFCVKYNYILCLFGKSYDINTQIFNNRLISHISLLDLLQSLPNPNIV